MRYSDYSIYKIPNDLFNSYLFRVNSVKVLEDAMDSDLYVNLEFALSREFYAEVFDYKIQDNIQRIHVKVECNEKFKRDFLTRNLDYRRYFSFVLACLPDKSIKMIDYEYSKYSLNENDLEWYTKLKNKMCNKYAIRFRNLTLLHHSEKGFINTDNIMKNSSTSVIFRIAPFIKNMDASLLFSEENMDYGRYVLNVNRKDTCGNEQILKVLSNENIQFYTQFNMDMVLSIKNDKLYATLFGIAVS